MGMFVRVAATVLELLREAREAGDPAALAINVTFVVAGGVSAYHSVYGNSFRVLANAMGVGEVGNGDPALPLPRDDPLALA